MSQQNRGRGRQPLEIAERTKRAIVRAATDVFARSGFEATSLRDIAQGAGTAHALIRHHFGSKEGVWRAVVDQATDAYRSALEACLADLPDRVSRDPAASLELAIRALIRVSAADPSLPRLLMMEAAQDGPRLRYILSRAAHSQVALGRLLKQVQQRGQLRQFDTASFLLFVTLAADGPFAFPGLLEAMTGVSAGDASFANGHADRLIDTLLPGSRRGIAK